MLAINDDPVSIKQIELAIVERAWEEGWIVAAAARDAHAGAASAVVGSGPAGLAAAAHLNRAGHDVVVYERDEGPGGLLRFGVPDFKLEKWYIDRRDRAARGRGRALRVRRRRRRGRDRRRARGAPRRGRARDRLARAPRARRARRRPARASASRWTTSTRATAGSRAATAEGDDPELTAAGKHVVVIGGGDTAMDCVGNAHREGATSVTVLDTYPAPPGPAARDSVPVARGAAPARQHLRARRGRRAALDPDRDAARRAATGASPPSTAPTSRRRPGRSRCRGRSSSCRPTSCWSRSASRIPSTPARSSSSGSSSTGAATSRRRRTRRPRAGVFAAGDARIGQSLVVNAIAEGRRCARVVDRHLAAVAGRLSAARRVVRAPTC